MVANINISIVGCLWLRIGVFLDIVTLEFLYFIQMLKESVRHAESV
jgi:hypothetical protein